MNRLCEICEQAAAICYELLEGERVPVCTDCRADLHQEGGPLAPRPQP